MSACNHTRHAAFTIVELLVAAAITVLIVVMLGTMFSSLSKTSSHANQSIDAFRDARAALQMMERDLSNIVRTQWQPDPFTVPAPATTQPITAATAYFALKDIYADPATGNQQIYMLAALKNTGKGDVCSVGYYCRWDDTIHAYTLRRFFSDSSATFATISGKIPYASEKVLYTPDAAGTKTNALKDETLASYVWDLQVVAYDANGATLTYPYVCDSSATTPTRMPAALEISFKAISPAAARTVMSVSTNASDWMDKRTPNYQRLIAPNAHEFRTRVEL